jgi:hypothetical protein
MQHYRFYGLVGTKILNAENVQCADDKQASSEAEARLGPSTFDAIEVWQGARRVCRHERSIQGAVLHG